MEHFCGVPTLKTVNQKFHYSLSSSLCLRVIVASTSLKQWKKKNFVFSLNIII